MLAMTVAAYKPRLTFVAIDLLTEQFSPQMAATLARFSNYSWHKYETSYGITRILINLISESSESYQKLFYSIGIFGRKEA